MYDIFARALVELWLYNTDKSIAYAKFIENYTTETGYNVVPTEDIHDITVGMTIFNLCNMTKKTMLDTVICDSYNSVIKSVLSEEQNICNINEINCLFLAQKYICKPLPHEINEYFSISKKIVDDGLCKTDSLKIYLVIFFSIAIQTFYTEHLYRIGQYREKRNELESNFIELVKSMCNEFNLNYSIMASFLNKTRRYSINWNNNKIYNELVVCKVIPCTNLWNKFVLGIWKLSNEKLRGYSRVEVDYNL